MVDPDVWNSGREGSPNEKLDWYLREICSMLKDLSATEMVWDRFEQLDQWWYDETNRGVLIHRTDSTAQTKSDYPFTAEWINDFTVMDEELRIEREYKATTEIQDCWDRAPSFSAEGIKSQCSLVVKPQVNVLTAHAHTLGAAADEMYEMTTGLDKGDSESMPGFVRNLQKNGWSEGSLSSDSFFDFYGDLSDLTYRYAEGAYHLATRSAAAAGIVEEYQNILNEIGLKTRQEVINSLKYWQTNKAPYSTTMTRTAEDTIASQVSTGVATAATFLALIPAISAPTGVVGAVATITAGVTQSYDITIDSSSVRAASAIYDDLAKAVAKCQEELLNALDKLQTEDVNAGGSFQQYVKDAQNNGGWNPPTVSI